MAKTKKSRPIPDERMKYQMVVNEIVNAADAVAENRSMQWHGMIRLGCALQGMELIPYNNIDYMDRATHWRTITLEDDETYFIVPFNTFNGEHDGGNS